MKELVLEEVAHYLTEVCKFDLNGDEVVLSSVDQGIIQRGEYIGFTFAELKIFVAEKREQKYSWDDNEGM